LRLSLVNGDALVEIAVLVVHRRNLAAA